MKICGGVVAIKKLAFANSYRTVVDQKPQFPPVFRSGNMCVNCGVSSGKYSLFLMVAILAVHACAPCRYIQTLWQQGEIFICAPSNPRKNIF